jgi:hypothetical protein
MMWQCGRSCPLGLSSVLYSLLFVASTLCLNVVNVVPELALFTVPSPCVVQLNGRSQKGNKEVYVCDTFRLTKPGVTNTRDRVTQTPHGLLPLKCWITILFQHNLHKKFIIDLQLIRPFELWIVDRIGLDHYLFIIFFKAHSLY